MTGFAHYELLERVYETGAAVVRRAQDRRTGDRVALKTIKPAALSQTQLARLQHEYEILRALSAPFVARALDFIEDAESGSAIVIEDLDGELLAARIDRGEMDVAASLAVAARLAEALGHIHGQGVVHRDISPESVVVSADLCPTILELGLSTRLPREMQSLHGTGLFESSLAYISPEQTGRMNRSVDYRADLYSLGATLYAMLIGRPPFTADDPLGLVHCHIAKQPAPPAELDPRIPHVVSAIVLKLLSKMAEDRYQSAFGLLSDLEECLRRLDRSEHIEPFPLGQRDVPARFQLPQKLYGRAAEIAELERALERASVSVPEIVLVSGPAGVGKSATIRELQRSLTWRGGFFAAGKFDQYKQEIPFSAVAQALNELIAQILAEREGTLERFRQTVQSALGSAGRVLSEVVPDLELLIGRQPDVPALPPAESMQRLRALFQAFVQAVAQPGRPLVLFLDDLHAADSSSIELLSALLGDRGTGGFLVIGAYRDDEVSPSHPLHTLIAQTEAAGVRLTRITVEPLTLSSVVELVGDALGLEAEDARPLATFIWEKTRGNPLFVGGLLMALYKDHLLSLDSRALRWTWDIERIKRAAISKDLVEMMAARARLLSERARKLLTIAACIGDRFRLDVLATAAEQSQAETASALEEIVEEGLILPLGESHRHVGVDHESTDGSRPPNDAAPIVMYQFFHDRVQQAACLLVREDELCDTHLRIARLSWERTPKAELDEMLFDLARHYNLGTPRLTSAEERRRVIELNLRAGRRARATSAFSSAAGYLAAGAARLTEASWEGDYELAYELHLELAECAYATGDNSDTERLATVLLGRARAGVDKARAYHLLARLYQSTSDPAKSLEMAVLALGELGVKIAPLYSAEEVSEELTGLLEALRRRSDEDLLSLPLTSDPAAVATIDLLSEVYLAGYMLGFESLRVIAACRVVSISLERGVSGSTAMGFSLLGMILVMQLDRYQEGYRFGKVAYDLVEKHNFLAYKAKVCNAFGGLISHWTQPVDVLIAYSREGVRASRESGDSTYGSFNYVQVIAGLFFKGTQLNELYEETVPAVEYLKRGTYPDFADIVRSYQLFIRGMRAETRSLSTWSSEGFHESAYEERMSRGTTPATRASHYIRRLHAHLIAEDFDDARSVARKGEPLIWSIPGSILKAEYFFYAALAEASAIPCASSEEGTSKRDLLAEHEGRLRVWAQSSPSNYSCMHALVSAELARAEARDADAKRLYDEAIRASRRSGFPHIEALSSEVAARFYRDRGILVIPDAYLQNARDCYARWGARAKVEQLEEKYPEILGRRSSAPPQPPSIRPLPGDSLPPSAASAGFLDVPSLIKASLALSSEITLDKLLARLLRVAAENAGAERGALVLDRAEGLAIMAEISAETESTVLTCPVPLEESRALSLSIVHYVVRTKRKVVLSDAANEGAFTKDVYVASRRPRSVLCLPLVHKGALKGVLYLENNLTPGAFTEERAQLLSVLGAHMAISIENAHLYAGLEQMVAERTRELREAQARLVKLEKEATEMQMAGGFAHEMRNSLTGATMLLQRVQRGQEGEASVCHENSRALKDLYLEIRAHVPEGARPRVAALVKKLNENEEQLDETLRDVGEAIGRALTTTHLILDYSKLGRERPVREPVGVLSLVESVLRESKEDFATNGITVEVAVGPERVLFVKEAHLYSMMKNLVINARDALVEQHRDALRSITVRLDEERDRYALRVSDTGIGIPGFERDKIFEPFFSTKPETGTGLGLSVVRKLSWLYGGSVEVESEVGRGTTFSIVFPKLDPEVTDVTRGAG